MSWLGNGFREEAKALSDAYASMYKAAEEADEVIEETQEEPQELSEEGKTPIQAALESDKKLMKLHTKDKPAPKGYTKEELEATGLFTAEEIENLVELSSDTLKSYAGKADADHERLYNKVFKAERKGKHKKADKHETKAISREAGISRALSKLNKQKEEKGEPTTDYERISASQAKVAAKDPSLMDKVKGAVKKILRKEESDILNALQDAYIMMYEKKKDSDKCGDGTYWDKEEKKCKSKKKKSNTTVVVGRGGIYGPGYHGGGGGSNGGGDGGDTDGGDGGDGGGDGGGGGGGE